LAWVLFAGRLSLPRSVAETGLHVLCFVWQGCCLPGAGLCHAAWQRQAFMYYVLFGKGVVCRAPVFATQHGRDRPSCIMFCLARVLFALVVLGSEGYLRAYTSPLHPS
jgi:hypothetical protein